MMKVCVVHSPPIKSVTEYFMMLTSYTRQIKREDLTRKTKRILLPSRVTGELPKWYLSRRHLRKCKITFVFYNLSFLIPPRIRIYIAAFQNTRHYGNCPNYN